MGVPRRLYLIEMAIHGLMQTLKAGGTTLVVIVICSVIVLAVAIERAVAMWRFLDRSRTLAEALVTTAAGIIVAIEAVVIYNFFMARLQRISLELKLMAEEFVEVLREQPRERKGEAEAALARAQEA